ncbi:hypothetical protein G6F70_001925 [Rhizopus microsporus]|nr:hypothetical protein G6F71_003785 [Rhizopus microsporus]KAG1202838.1 hypothetical protein G6F70_001925 [Rhizopus microsporus]KAG1212486.1 hypothetical protein G6F69_003670 [Rhizopus microsporus]KAG1234521.1 hypothetical protein G6F67_003470 [Rhizopus microsporus]KAG1266478.1 hypothetical protein G6F68_002715 [Rhizopus microsporus]
MEQKKDDDPPLPKAKRNKGTAVDRGFLSLFAQTQTNLFKNITFEVCGDDFQETPLVRKDKNIRTSLKAAKENASAPDPSNVVINKKVSMLAVNKDTSVQAVLPVPTPSTSSTSAPIKTFKKYQAKNDKAETLKKEKKRIRRQVMSKNKHDILLVVELITLAPPTICAFKYISELPTLKTANLTLFLLAASTRLQNYQRIHNYYCQDKWPQKLKFKTYINKQKGTQEIVKRLFDNSKKYGTSSTVGAKNQNPNKSKHVPLSPADLPSSSQRKRIIAFGNGSLVKYLTSQICNKCKSKQLNNISLTGSKRRVHFVLKCESCGTVWNRDVNSALNIYGIFVYKSKHDNESSPSFKRPSED